MNACYLIPIAVYLLSSCSIIQSAPINNPMLTPQFNTIVPVGGGTPVGASGDLTPSEVNQYCIGGDKSAIPSASHSIGQAQTLLHSVMATLVQGIETATEWKTSCNEMQPVRHAVQYMITSNIGEVHAITGTQYDKSCSYTQQAINSSLPYLKCYSHYIGHILADLTNNITASNAATLNEDMANSMAAFRQSVYDSYENITGISDVARLVGVFPCQQNSLEPLETNECIPYEELEGTFGYDDCYDDKKCNCFYHQLPDNHLLTKQIAVLAKIAYFLDRFDTQLSHYEGKCLQSSVSSYNSN